MTHLSASAKQHDDIIKKDHIVQKIKANQALPDVDARAWALYEYNSGLLVSGKNPNAPYPPASITKLMTNYVVFKALENGDIDLQDSVTISEKAWRTEGSRMFAEVGAKIQLQKLLKSTVIQSGNDAAVAIAEHTAGNEASFAIRMNDAAKEIGLKSSHFQNATGLPAQGHVMTASDIAILAGSIVRDFPDHYNWYSEKQYTYDGIVQYNRNKLLWKDSSVDGLKTGHTNAAGFCLVGSALRNGQRWIAVVLGSSDARSREKAVLTLLNYAYDNYQPVRLLDQQGGLTKAQVYFGEVDEVLLQAQGVANLVVPAGRSKDVVSEFQLSPYYQAPIEAGQAMGVVSLSLDNKRLADVPLISMSTIKRGGIWKLFVDSIKLRWREFREK